jgi:hypothetical protein
VQDAVRVAVRHARTHLVQVPLDDASVVADVRVRVQVFLQVDVEVLEDEVELLVLVDDVHQAATRARGSGERRWGVWWGSQGGVDRSIAGGTIAPRDRGGGRRDRIDRSRVWGSKKERSIASSDARVVFSFLLLSLT